MARYFFHLHECGETTLDSEGLELPDDESIIREARRAARAVMAAEVLDGRLCMSCRIEVEREGAGIVYVLPFRDAVELTGLS